MSDISIRPGAGNWRIAIAVAQFNPTITGMLLEGARQTLTAAGVDDARLKVFDVPGAWELPLASQYLAESGSFDAVIAIGAVVRGETAHFEFISAECARGLQQVALDTGIPVAFGVLTPESRSQALERADPKRKNKGREVALAALDMIELRSEAGS
ncbi:6,7-dimethyl-8-ribityllumazine synthase [Wenzhouxiangella sp. AB-CW3]|uniref:6,7-dimethyl-8-ribityllumazine synthase n=1 Tax=Wenzhouxiangella sp. AB-CW3 TaxID=2771012 RepID=UPI00168AE4D6|nr:6,7-dimethyl-8-ribityllumazine synthase [Wenzhouxiangella sp. AB-CW3]QOC23413.1 6,7-dimethyl-8-ribityllumazine synthase [Wenzhouxiangella sp. AB-CW3]